MRGEQRVVGERHLRHRTAAEALFRHEGEAERAPLRGIEAARGLSEDRDRVGVGERPLARQRGHQFLLPVARDAGDAKHFAMRAR